MTMRRATVWLVLAAASWGLGTVIAKRAVAEVAPLTLLAVQLLSSVVLLTVLMRVRGVPLRDAGAPALLGRLGLLNPGLAYALSLTGLVSISASLSVLLWALEPLLILVLAALVLRERISSVVVGLSVLAIVGLLSVAGPAVSASGVGVALTIAGVIACAIYTIVVRRSIATSDSTAQVVLAQQVHALALILGIVVVAALGGRGTGLEGVTAAGLISAVASGIVYFAVAYWCYLTALRRLPANVAAASFYLVPVFGVVGGFTFLGDMLSVLQWLGVAVAAGAVISILARTIVVEPALVTRSIEAPG
jgi:drug/metabolite transporter (DMT)-like permease